MDTKTKDQTATAPALLDEAANAEFITALGHRVREARARRGMSRKALAISSAVSERYLAQVESGETNPSIMVLRHVAHALGISLLELVEPQQGSNESRLIARKSTGEIEELLGYVDEPEIIHRDNLILIG